MPRRPVARRAAPPIRRKRKRRPRLAQLLPSTRARRQWMRGFRSAPLLMQLVVCLAFALTLWLAVNWVYQVVRKPSELFFPVSGTLYKTPTETWR